MLSGDEVLQKLAFQAGVLALLRDQAHVAAEAEKALETIDFLIEILSQKQPVQS